LVGPVKRGFYCTNLLPGNAFWRGGGTRLTSLVY
jgi:hypothetical protein